MDDPCGLGGCSASVLGLIKQPTYTLNSTQPHIFLPPKHHQNTSNMLQIDIGCWNWGLEGVGFWPILAPLLLLFLRKWPKIDISPTTGSFHSNSFAIMFVYYKSTKTPKIM